jgi:hypothetical protein
LIGLVLLLDVSRPALGHAAQTTAADFASPSVAPAARDGRAASHEEPSSLPQVESWLSNWTRLESWRFFEPPAENVDPGYTFFGNRADLGVRVRAARIDLTGAFSYVRIQRLPTDAIGPGGLGTGAFYFAATGLPYSYQVFLTELTLAAHDPARRFSVTLGRMPYTSGAEGEAATGPAMADGTDRLAELRRLRLDGRVLGSFDWSFYQRRFDGVKVHARGRRAYAGGGAFFVTQGGYEESSSLTMTRLQVGSIYAGLRHSGRAETQMFTVGYRDRRAVEVRPDNAAVSVKAADVTVFTVGGSHLATRRTGRGEIDWLAWGAGQGGHWYGQRHRAFSAALEGGYRWNRAAGQPWVRAGASYASGDDTPGDDQHRTYFPTLQNTRTYALSMAYAQMNLRDLYAQVLAAPHPRAQLRLDVHRVDLASAADRWYQGSGATARDGYFFGFSTRLSGGERTLGTVLEGTANWHVSRYWSLNGYAGRMWGGAVVRRNFARDRLFYWYVENVLRFVLPR